MSRVLWPIVCSLTSSACVCACVCVCVCVFSVNLNLWRFFFLGTLAAKISPTVYLYYFSDVHWLPCPPYIHCGTVAGQASRFLVKDLGQTLKPLEKPWPYACKERRVLSNVVISMFFFSFLSLKNFIFSGALYCKTFKPLNKGNTICSKPLVFICGAWSQVSSVPVLPVHLYEYKLY